MTTPEISNMQDILDALEASPELQRAFHQHLLKVIRADDGLRQELRKEILTDELLQLPARFLRLERAVEQLLQDMTEVKEQQTKMSGQIANLAGSDYESKAIEQSRRMIRHHLSMLKASVVHASRWEIQTFEENVLLPAIDNGSINRQQADQLEDADSIIRCEDRDGNMVHAVVEISITVEDTDRRRAAERAEIMAAATATPTTPFVVGQEQAPRGAGVPNVTFLTYSG